MDGFVIATSVNACAHFAIAAVGGCIARKVVARVTDAAVWSAAKFAVLFSHLVFTGPIEWIACALGRPRPSYIFIQANGCGRVVTYDGRTDAVALHAAIGEGTEVVIVTKSIVVDRELASAVLANTLSHVTTVGRSITSQSRTRVALAKAGFVVAAKGAVFVVVIVVACSVDAITHGLIDAAGLAG